MDFCERLDGLLKEKGLTAKGLTEKLDVGKTTINDWKRGKSTPSPRALIGLSHIFDVSVDWLLTGTGPKYAEDVIPYLDGLKSKLGVITDLEYNLLVNFRALPESEKHRILGNIEGKAEVYSAIPKSKKASATRILKRDSSMDMEIGEIILIERKVYDQDASAGLGNYLDSHSSYEMMSFKESEVPPRANFGIRISGDSMEPDIKDGSIVWVEERIEIESGEIGIFILNNEALCKKLHVDYAKRVVQLISLNTKYSAIKLGEHDDLRTVGKVILH